MTTKENVLNEILDLGRQLTMGDNIVKYDIETNTLGFGYTINADYIQCRCIIYDLNKSLDANLDDLEDAWVNAGIDHDDGLYCDVGHS